MNTSTTHNTKVILWHHLRHHTRSVRAVCEIGRGTVGRGVRAGLAGHHAYQGRRRAILCASAADVIGRAL